MSIVPISFFINFYFSADFFSKVSLFAQPTPGFNFFKILFPFKDTWAFLDYVWTLMLSNKINTFILFLVLFLGFILMCWAAREVMTWFLQTRKITKQNQLLIRQNKVLVNKIETMNITLNSMRTLFTAERKEADISEVSQKTSLVSDIDDPLIDIHESPFKDSLPKESSLDT